MSRPPIIFSPRWWRIVRLIIREQTRNRADEVQTKEATMSGFPALNEADEWRYRCFVAERKMAALEAERDRLAKEVAEWRGLYEAVADLASLSKPDGEVPNPWDEWTCDLCGAVTPRDHGHVCLTKPDGEAKLGDIVDVDPDGPVFYEPGMDAKPDGEA